MSKFRPAVLFSMFALLLTVAFSAPSHGQFSTESIPKLLYADSYLSATNSNSLQAYFWGIVSTEGDSTYLATADDQYFGYVSSVKFTDKTITFTLDGFNMTGSGYFSGTVQATSSGTITTVLQDYFTGEKIYSSKLKKVPGFIFIVK